MKRPFLRVFNGGGNGHLESWLLVICDGCFQEGIKCHS